MADSVAGGTYSFVGTCVILFILNLIPGLQLRADEDAEILGIDDAEIGTLLPPPHPASIIWSFSFFFLPFFLPLRKFANTGNFKASLPTTMSS